MANTLRLTYKFDYLDDGTAIRTKPSKIYDVTTSSDLYHETVQLVGTTHEAVSAGDVTDAAMGIIENLHATAIVQIGYDSGGTFYGVVTVNPGEIAHLPRITSLSATYLDSDTASTPVRVTLCKIS